MLKIDQYASFFSLYAYALLLIPSLICGLRGKKFRLLNLTVSIVMLCLLFGFLTLQFYEFWAFFLFNIILIKIYLVRKNNGKGNVAYYICFMLSLMPLLLVKVCSKLDVAARLGSPFSIDIGFVGMSYVCFKVWQLLFDIHDDKIKELKFIDLAGFLLFAPSFSSGPIARYETFLSESRKAINGKEYANDYLFGGLKKIFFGIFYKFALAFFIDHFFMSKIGELNVTNAILYAYAYTFYLFFDFAGYSLMAVGTGMLMGVKLPDNFNMPFLARNMKEFWTRWHISLSTWFNDYAFSRFVLTTVRKGIIKNPKSAARWAYLFTMGIMGIWHGFYWHYIIYGLYQGVMLVLTDFWVKSKRYRKVIKMRGYNTVSRIVCLQFIVFGMLLFSGYLIKG